MDIYYDENVTINSEIMPNGENRYRLIGNCGGSYIRTVARTSNWEKSHYHNLSAEMYIVQRGWVIFAQYVNDKEILFAKYSAGEHFISEPMIPHNIYISEGTITHTVKYGESTNSDWNEFEKLDKLISVIDLKNYLSKETNGILKVDTEENRSE